MLLLMWTACIVAVVLAGWKALSIVDDYADIRLADRLGRAVIIVLGVVAVLNPPQFAEGTTQFIDRQTKEFLSWFLPSIVRALPTSPTTTEGG